MLSMLVFAAALAVPATDGGAAPICKKIAPATVGNHQPVRAQKLNELPNADHYLTVLRTDENGCNAPAIVNYDIGSAPKRQR
jgi:hypothetical protein